MADVFISHSSKDHVIAEHICALLESRGVSCWMAPRDIKPGEEWAKAINDAITSASVFLIIYSANSAASIQVPKEIGLAGARNSYIVPYKIDNTSLEGEFEYYLLGSHWIVADIPKNDYKIDDLYNVVMAQKTKSVDGGTYIQNMNVTELTANNVTVAAPEEKKKKNTLPLIIALIAAVVILVVVLIVMIVSGNNSNKNNSSDNEISSVPSASTTEAENVNSTQSTTTDTDSSQEDTEPETEDSIIIWDGSVDTSWYDGESSSYSITTPQQLAGLSKLVNDGNSMLGVTFTLENDLYLNEDYENYKEWSEDPPENKFTPIGTHEKLFCGNFNGNGNVIYGLYINCNNLCTGLFSSVVESEISKLALWYGMVEASNNAEGIMVGAVAGLAMSSKISECDVLLIVSAKNDLNIAAAGGIAGYIHDSEVINCSNFLPVTAKSTYDIYQSAGAGGIACISTASTIRNCYSDYAYAEDLNADDGVYGGMIATLNPGITKIINCCYNQNEAGDLLVCGDVARSNYVIEHSNYSIAHNAPLSEDIAARLGDAFIFENDNLYLAVTYDHQREFENSEYSYSQVDSLDMATVICNEYLANLRKTVENDDYNSFKLMFDSERISDDIIASDWSAYKSWFSGTGVDSSQVYIDAVATGQVANYIQIKGCIFCSYLDENDQLISDATLVNGVLTFNKSLSSWQLTFADESINQVLKIEKDEFYSNKYGLETYYNSGFIDAYDLLTDTCIIAESGASGVAAAVYNAQENAVDLILYFVNGFDKQIVFSLNNILMSSGTDSSSSKSIIDLSRGYQYKGVDMHGFNGKYKELAGGKTIEVLPKEICYTSIRISADKLLSPITDNSQLKYFEYSHTNTYDFS